MARRSKPHSRLDRPVTSIVRLKPQLPRAKGSITRVRFFGLTRDATVEVIGDVLLKDGQIITDPPDRLALRNILAEPVWLPDGDGWRFIYPDTQPEEFLAALPKECNGSYFWAEAVED